MVVILLAGILIIGFITLISKSGSETLTDYANNNPELAYAESDSSWKDTYSTADPETQAGEGNTDTTVSPESQESSVSAESAGSSKPQAGDNADSSMQP